MTLVLDTEWQLVYPGCDLTFGSRQQAIFNRTTPDFGDYEVRSSDGDRARADGRDFGVDFFGGRTIAFDLGVIGATEAAVRASAAALGRAWRADSVRSSPGAVAELRSRYRGEERVVYGRPRRFSTDLSGAATQRFASVVADFECTDNVFYGRVPQSETIALAPAAVGGLMAPLASPLSTTASSDRSVILNVASDLPAWPVITITGGAITNPVIEVIGLWRFQVNGSFAYDRTITIDTRPWSRSVTIDGGGSLAGSLSRDSVRLGKAGLTPGLHELAFRGRSDDRTATATISWQGAYTTP